MNSTGFSRGRSADSAGGATGREAVVTERERLGRIVSAARAAGEGSRDPARAKWGIVRAYRQVNASRERVV